MGIQDPIAVIVVILGGALALAGLIRPRLGVLILILIYFVQPGELFPSLAPFRIELVYASLLLLSFALQRASSLGRRLFSNRIFAGGILLLGVAALTVPFAVWRGGALNQTIALAKLVVLMFLIGTLIDSTAHLRSVVWVLVALLAWFAGSGLVAYSRGDISYQEGLERAQGINSMAGGPNELAGLILALLPFLLAAFRCSRNVLVRLILLTCGGLALTTLVLTGARAAMLSLAAITAYYVLRSKHSVITLALVIILAVTIWLEVPQKYKERYQTVRSYAAGAELDASNELRLRVWKAGWKMFLDHPILGVGAGQFSTAYGTVYAGRGHVAWMNPHSLFLQVACDLGVVGLLAFGYFVTQIVKQLRLRPPADRKSPLELNYQVAVACGALLLGLVAMSVVSHTLYRPYWYLLGGLVAANRFVADQIEKSEVGSGTGESVGASREAGSQLAPAIVLVDGKT